MEWYIILLIAAAAVAGLIIGYLVKRHKDLIIDTSLLNEYNLQIEEKEEKLNKITEQTNSLKEKFNDIKRETDSAINSFNKLTESLKEAQERELKIFYENGLEEIKRKLIKADKELALNYEQNKLRYNEEINKIKSELDTFKTAREAIINDQKRQEEMETNQKFYMLQISQYDKEDIIQLRTIEPKLHNKEVLNKLIFETYYRRPMADLFGRISGNNKPCGIYKITNIKNKKAYIGKSVEIIPKRWTEHIKTSLNIGSISHTKIHDAMKEHGIENFTFEILEECSKEKLNEREKYWIAFYETNTYGYNIKSGG